jgi:hypothetical protein
VSGGSKDGVGFSQPVLAQSASQKNINVAKALQQINQMISSQHQYSTSSIGSLSQLPTSHSLKPTSEIFNFNSTTNLNSKGNPYLSKLNIRRHDSEPTLD